MWNQIRLYFSLADLSPRRLSKILFFVFQQLYRQDVEILLALQIWKLLRIQQWKKYVKQNRPQSEVEQSWSGAWYVNLPINCLIHTWLIDLPTDPSIDRVTDTERPSFSIGHSRRTRELVGGWIRWLGGWKGGGMDGWLVDWLIDLMIDAGSPFWNQVSIWSCR